MANVPVNISRTVIRRVGGTPSLPPIQDDGTSYDPQNPPGVGAGPTHPALTLGANQNGLSLDVANQVLQLGLASSSANGALSSSDWTTFNNKIGGTIASGQVAFGTGAGVIGGDNGISWDNSNKTLQLNDVKIELRSNKVIIINSEDNKIESGSGINTISGGGNSSFPNLIGFKTKPTGIDFTPPAWSDDTFYVDNTATVALISGGYDHVNNQQAGVIVGGGHNFLKYDVNGHSFIGGGSYNIIEASMGFIGAGRANAITGGTTSLFSAIVSGDQNEIIGGYSFIAGGDENKINGSFSFAFGRRNVVNGLQTHVFGRDNTVNASFSNVFGRRNVVNADGIFSATDNQNADFASSTINTFNARFANGYRLTGGNVGIGGVADTKLHVFGAIKQTSVINSLLKSDSNGLLVQAIAGTDYQTPITNPISGLGVPNQVSFFTGANSISGDSGITYLQSAGILSLNNKPNGYLLFDQRKTGFISGATGSAIYQSGSGGSYPFNDIGHLVLQTRSNQVRDIVFVAGNPASVIGRFTTSGFSIGDIAPTNTLDVNGTARIRSIANGVGNVLTTSGTGVIQERTGAQLIGDIGAVEEAPEDGVLYGRKDGEWVGVENSLLLPFNWNQKIVDENENRWSDIAFGNGFFVSVSNIGDNRIMRSSNGIDFDLFLAPEQNDWFTVKYLNGRFIAVSLDGDNRLMHSVDGQTWTLSTPPSSIAYFTVSYGNGVYVVAGTNGNLSISTDLISWSSVINISSFNIRDIVFANNTFIAVGGPNTGANNSAIWRSTNGTSWTTVTTDFTVNLRKIAYGSGVLVAVGQATQFGVENNIKSIDLGITWTADAIHEPTNRGGLSIVFANNIFVKVSSSNITISEDLGDTWFFSGQFNGDGISFGNKRFVVVRRVFSGTSGTGAIIYSNQIKFLTEAPLDGNQYGRQNGSWTEIEVPEIDLPTVDLGENRYHFPLSSTSTVITMPDVGEMRFCAFYQMLFSNVNKTADRIAVNITSAGASNNEFRLGIFEFVGGTMELVEDCGLVNAGTTGVKELTISVELEARKLYFLGIARQNSASNNIVFTAAFQHSDLFASMSDNIWMADSNLGYRVTGVTGAFDPDYTPTGPSLVPPMITLRLQNT